jgi:hypothetical protein
MIFENSKNYDRLKLFATRILPALITFYGVVGTTLKIPYTTETLTIASAFETMICTFLGISKKKFNELNAEFENEENTNYEVEEE